MNQTQEAINNRAGIMLRDYTTAGGDEALRRGFFERINFTKVARVLSLVGLGLGIMQLVMPKRVQKLVGVRRGDHSGLIRLMGLREIMSTLLIFAGSRPVQGVWSRVAGGAIDLGLLGAASSTRRVKKDHLAIAAASVLGISALDALTAKQLSRKRGATKLASTFTQKDLDNRTRSGAFQVTRSITINRSPEELYNFWRGFERLPQFMYHLEEVRMIDERRSHWVAKAPAGKQVEWDAEITEDRPNELIAWQSLPDADVPNSGQVRFEQAPAGRGTVVRVEIDYRPPGGAIGKAVAFLFGEEPGQQVDGDLRRFKQVMEIGEVVRSEGSPKGYGQKSQHPARPKADKNVERMSRFESKQQQRERASSRIEGTH